MAKNSKKKKKKKSGAAPGVAPAPSEQPAAAASLGVRPSARRKVEKPSRKQEAALAKKEARTKWAERMTSEGR